MKMSKGCQNTTRIANLIYISRMSCYMSLFLVLRLPQLLSSGLQCSFGNLLGLHALMAEFRKSQKEPDAAKQNLKERSHYAV